MLLDGRGGVPTLGCDGILLFLRELVELCLDILGEELAAY